jgi:hypothetical protein
MQIFNNITSEGNEVIYNCEFLTESKALKYSIRLTNLIDEITVILVDLKVIPKNDDVNIPKMLSTHPVAGLQTKCLRLVANLVSQCPLAVVHIEQNMDEVESKKLESKYSILGCILSHTRVDFVNVGLREQAMLCIKYCCGKCKLLILSRFISRLRYIILRST